METSGSVNQKIAPPGAIFLSLAERQEWSQDFGVQRTLRLMNTEQFPPGMRGSEIVAKAIVQNSVLLSDQ